VRLFLSKNQKKSIVIHTFHNFTQAARERNSAVVIRIGCVFGGFRYTNNSRSTPAWRKIISKSHIIQSLEQGINSIGWKVFKHLVVDVIWANRTVV